MDAGKEIARKAAKNPTTVESRSDREILVTRTFNAPARIVFKAWTTPALFQRWWLPKSVGIGIVSYEADIRVGGTYRLLLSHPSAPEPIAFFGTYKEVTPHSRLVWTNEEAGDQGQLTTVTFEEKGEKTLVVLQDLYPTKEARDAALASGAYDGMDETFGQLDEVLRETS